MILETAKRHFDEDMARATAALDHARAMPAGTLKDDVLRLAWMMAVGASDAFFCDAYADVLSRTLRAKTIQPNGEIPDRLGNLKVPVVAILRDGGDGWRWRMAARELIEDDNVLSLDKVKKLLNLFFRDGHKLMTEETVESWITHADGRQRLLGTTRGPYNRLAVADKNRAKKAALKRLEERMDEVFQRRHDCIHNCDRPKVAPQGITEASAEKAMQDVRFVVERCCEATRAEFPEYLRARRFNAVTRNRVGA